LLRAHSWTLEAVQKDLGLTNGQMAELNRWIKTAKGLNRETEAKLREISPARQLPAAKG